MSVVRHYVGTYQRKSTTNIHIFGIIGFVRTTTTGNHCVTPATTMNDIIVSMLFGLIGGGMLVGIISWIVLKPLKRNKNHTNH